MRLIISFAALFLSVILLQLSTGGVGPLDAISGLTLNFTTEQIGLLGSGHFLGFFIGCWWAPRLMGNVGHSRAFAVCTALGAMGLLGHTLTENPYAWAAMRMASGLCVAGCYTVIEAWLNAKVTNETRGRAMGTYRLADLSASLAAQLIIAVLPPAAYISYNLLALLCCAALLPLTLTRASQPEIPDAPRLRPKLAWRCSPLAVAGVIVAALSSASFRMVGPIYGQEVGLEIGQIAFFLASFVLGGALAQYPMGWLADKYDRRWVLIWLSGAAILSCGITMAASGTGTLGVMVTAGFFGFTTFPIFSVSAAHANDFATTAERVELSAALMFWYALGAIASPYVSSALIDAYGPPALFAYVAGGHVLLIVFGLSRMKVRATPEERTSYVYAPRTSFTIGRLLKRTRERRK
ncbi:MFS transporter [Leisingera aquaemixtae]|jgi:MFS family permease|uniref:MFS transporter n=1 Tax=Leisingera aquaemixtae TaxID=1396826 RepID=A0A0N7M3X3_9RHOB|nr:MULTISPECIES: MFS transporter [Leisingera]QDI75129.1 MFS transporter [Leisingera aquaemixtae]UWQ23767.1 MFS transporter [Leisingera aquaemixtae]UWQ40398.1 MFS transporter [Leisingera aquaemixtae]UWQ44651.1 MFS transporter [Leisingera aquaemixtae]CUH98034.1 putative MFS-type transporter YcaD [Leisingera aquaemixtae]